MEYFILAKNKQLAAIPVDRKLFKTYQKLGYRFLEKTSSCDYQSALKRAKRKYQRANTVKWVTGISIIFVAYWAYFYALLA